jgi:hypothetical protein
MHRIARKLQPVVDHENVRRPQLALYQVFAMEEAQGIESRGQQLGHFVRREGTPGEDFRQVLVRILHDHKEKFVFSELTAAGVEDANQVRMGQGGGHPPAPQHRLCLGRIGRDELDRGVDRVRCRILGEEDPAMVRATQQAP